LTVEEEYGKIMCHAITLTQTNLWKKKEGEYGEKTG
jgi:hypothetical protein